MPALKTEEEFGQTALERFEELAADMGWSEDVSVKQLAEEVAAPLGLSKKAVQQWFERRRLPGYIAYNVALVLGIDERWFFGSPSVTKEQAIKPGGLYDREVRRARMQRAG